MKISKKQLERLRDNQPAATAIHSILTVLLNGGEITITEDLKPCLYNCTTELRITIGVGDLPYATSCSCGALGKYYFSSDLAKSKHNELYNLIHKNQ